MKKYIILMLVAITLILGSCNSDGNGIFFQISQEVKQITSEISELPVHQVVEVDSTVYARTGSKVWVKSASKWTDVSKGNHIYNIVEYNSSLYGNINNDDVNLNGGKIMSYDGSSWSLVTDYATDITLFEADDNYILLEGTTDILSSTSDLSSFVSSTLSGMNILDGAYNGTIGILISKNKIYESAFGVAMTEQTLIGDATGELRGITIDTTNNFFYIINSSGDLYKSDVNGQNWVSVNSISEHISYNGALGNDIIDLTEYLIIGTDNGYYEMEIGTTTISKPSATTSVLDFDTSYPELATELVFEVYPSSTANEFYLATSKGLWKRNTDGTFTKQ